MEIYYKQVFKSQCRSSHEVRTCSLRPYFVRASAKIKILLMILLLAECLTFSGFINFENKQVYGDNCEFIEKSMKEIETIKVGMKRKDLIKIFHQDGGVSAINQPRFVYEKCSFIKIDVKFEPVDKNKKFAVDNSEDKIVEISKPYFEHPFYD